MKHSTIILRALVALLVAAPALAQTRGPRLDVAVHVARVAISGDTIEIGYVLENRRATPMPIGSLAIVTPATIISLVAPRDRHDWETFRNHGDELMPTWAAMGESIRAGESSPVLTMRAVGLTDLVSYYAVPDIMETMKRDTIISDEVGDRYIEWGVKGTTVSVVPPPAGQTPARQVGRITTFLRRSCGADGWITNAGVCNSLSGKLARASEAIAAGNLPAARPHLSAFLAELEAQYGPQPGKHVTATAYALLRPNVAYLLR